MQLSNPATYLGCYRALVTSVSDPTITGRIRTQCPQVSGNAELNWALPVNSADPIPVVGSIIWVAFNGGDLTKPVYFSNSSFIYQGTGVLQVNSPVVKAGSSWQTPSLGANWSFSNIRSSLPLRYKIDIEDNLVIKGSVSCTSTTPATTVFSVIAPYLPTGLYDTQQGLIQKQSSAGSAFTFGHGFISAGAVSQSGFTFTSGDIISFDFTWPLGNIA